MIIAKLNGDLSKIGVSKRLFAFYIAVLSVAVVAGAARLYTAFVILALVLTLGISRRGWVRGLTLLGVAVSLYFLLNYQVAIVGDLGGRGFDVSLTGRQLIWTKTLRVAQAQPLLGYGFPSFDSPKFDWMWGLYRPGHPHNGFIQALFETGYVGLSLVLLLVAAHVAQAIRYGGRERRYSYALLLVLAAGFGSLTGANYGAKASLMVAFAMLAVSMEVREMRAKAAAVRPRVAPRLSGVGGGSF